LSPIIEQKNQLSSILYLLAPYMIDSPVIALADRTSLLVPTAVNKVLAEIREQQALGRQVVSMMRGEPDFDTPAHVVEAAQAALRAGRTRYPDNRGERTLRDAIATKLRRDGLEYDPAGEILVTTGATLGIQAALMALVNDGDEVLLPDPIYDAYASPIRLAGGRIRSIPCALRDGRFSLDPAALNEAIGPRSRVLILNTPWNPVGTVFGGEELRELAAVIVARGLTLISDEIYEAITYAPARHTSPATLSAAMRERTVIVNSLSKTYAMTGWRVGYCAAPGPLIQAMFLVLQQTSRGPATFVQDAAAAALTGPQTCVTAMQQEYAARRARVSEKLAGIPGVSVIPPEGGFFTMVDVRGLGPSSDDIRRRLLQQFGVAVMHGAAYGPAGEGTLRVSFGSGGAILDEGLERLARGLREMAPA
jgi:aspartate/methionine/tyrosine aminotransferase